MRVYRSLRQNVVGRVTESNPKSIAKGVDAPKTKRGCEASHPYLSIRCKAESGDSLLLARYSFEEGYISKLQATNFY